MKKFAGVIWVVVIMVASFMLYKVKYEVIAIKQDIVEASAELETEKEALRVLAAEWAYLSRPERLQKLAGKYLASTDLTVNQIAEIQEIPFPNRSVASGEQELAVKPVSLTMRKALGAR